MRAGDRELLASASKDGTVRLWDPATSRPERTLDGHAGWVNAVCAVRVGDRELLASAGNDRTARLWDPGQAHPLVSIWASAPIQAVVPHGPARLILGLTNGLLAVQIEPPQ